MQLERIHFMCPYLDGNPKGAVCNVVNYLIKDMQDIDLEICLGRHFEKCLVYITRLREMTVTPACQGSGEGQKGVTEF
jgi:hypothetical protein